MRIQGGVWNREVHDMTCTTKGRCFFWRFSAISWKVKYQCYLSNQQSRYWKCPPYSYLRTALFLVEQQFAMGLQKADCLFLIIYKDQQAANTIFWPFLSFLKHLQKLLCSFTFTSVMRSKDHKKAVNRTKKSYWQDVLFWYPDPS